jgi:hypothetical protein
MQAVPTLQTAPAGRFYAFGESEPHNALGAVTKILAGQLYGPLTVSRKQSCAGGAAVRLIIGGTSDEVWAYLEPTTVDEIAALERCVARGDWTIGRGDDTIRRLRGMAERLGHLLIEVREPVPRRQVVVQRGQSGLVALLRALTPPSVPIIADRRARDRRSSGQSIPDDRRRKDRRRAPSAEWGALRFHVAPAGDGPW